MSCNAGLNQYLTVPVPAANGDGPLFDVSGLVAEKTLYIAGDYLGQYVILGTHDDVHLVPIAQFSNGSGPQTIRRDIIATLKSIVVRRNASGAPVTINLAAQATCSC